jgi:GNAT superfamily N-acetyltransferase
MESEMTPRQARPGDIGQATDTIALAFEHDPVWSVALARSDGRIDHHRPYWRFFVASAVEQRGVWLLGDAAAVSVWIPPGGVELPPEQLAAVEKFYLAQLGAERAHQMDELFERFEANHPTAEPHAYLSLLATRPDHRGLGIGQGLLAANLDHWDGLGVPTYLESTNPANDHRYERAGFRRIGGFTSVRDGAPITTMWRVAGGPG